MADDDIKTLAQKIFRPEEKLQKTLQKRIEDDVEGVDDIVNSFHSSIKEYADRIAAGTFDEIRKEEGMETAGLNQRESKAYHALVLKMCFEFAKKREEVMYGTKE